MLMCQQPISVGADGGGIVCVQVTNERVWKDDIRGSVATQRCHNSPRGSQEEMNLLRLVKDKST